MSFYVELGPRGLFFRFGRMMVSCVGSVIYWRDLRRRRRLGAVRATRPVAVEKVG